MTKEKVNVVYVRYADPSHSMAATITTCVADKYRKHKFSDAFCVFF